MSISRKVFAGFGAAALLSLTAPVLAGPSEALAACKTEIATDARLSQFESVRQNTDDIKRRGRFTRFEINVRAGSVDGVDARWVAHCKARNNGKVETLELVQIEGHRDPHIAQTAN